LTCLELAMAVVSATVILSTPTFWKIDEMFKSLAKGTSPSPSATQQIVLFGIFSFFSELNHPLHLLPGIQ
jgi:hypothetical protein